MDIGDLVAEEEWKGKAFGVCTVPDYDDDATPSRRWSRHLQTPGQSANSIFYDGSGGI